MQKQTDNIKRAAFISLISRYSAAIVQLAYTVVLARMLTPAEFGIVAIAQVFVVFFGIFSDMGLGAAIVQKRNLSEQQIRGLGGFSVLLGLFLGSVFAACGYPIAALYSDAELVPICAALSVSLVFTTWNIVPTSLLQKEMRFVELGVRQVVSCTFAAAASIACAYAGAGVYAIVVYSVMSSFVVFVWNTATVKLVPRFRGALSSVRAVFSYSFGLFGANLINYFYRNLDNLAIGFFFGNAMLGQYSKAYQLTTYPQTYLTAAIEPVLHPVLAKKQDDTDLIYHTYIKVSKALSLLGVFITVFAVFFADDIVLAFYGSQWEAAVPCFQLLALSVWTQMVSGTAGAMFRVLNKPFEQLRRSLIICAATFLCVGAGVVAGSIEAVAGFMAAGFYVAFFALGYFLIKRSFGRRIGEFYKAFLPDMLVCIIFTVGVFAVSFIPIGNKYLMLLVSFLICVPLYCLILVGTSQMKWLILLLPKRYVTKMPAFIRKGFRDRER